MSNDVFSDDNKKANSNFVKWSEVGQKVSGYLVKKEIWDNKLKAGTKQTVYTLHQDDGTLIQVAGRYGNPAVFPGLETCKMGQKVGLKYTEEKKHPKPGFNAIKVIETYAADDHRPDLVIGALAPTSEESEGQAF